MSSLRDDLSHRVATAATARAGDVRPTHIRRARATYVRATSPRSSRAQRSHREAQDTRSTTDRNNTRPSGGDARPEVRREPQSRRRARAAHLRRRERDHEGARRAHVQDTRLSEAQARRASESRLSRKIRDGARKPQPSRHVAGRRRSCCGCGSAAAPSLGWPVRTQQRHGDAAGRRAVRRRFLLGGSPRTIGNCYRNFRHRKSPRNTRKYSSCALSRPYGCGRGVAGGWYS